MAKEYYSCKYCEKILKSEKAYIEHYCEGRKRHDKLTTINGQIAFHIYQRWVKIQSARIVDYDNFKLSRYFHALCRFAKYYKAIKGLEDLDDFLYMMITKRIYPTNWMDSRVIAYYFAELEKVNPREKIEKTCKNILKICESYECETNEFYNQVEFHIMIEFIRVHKLSPWILLNSKRFFTWLESLADYEQDVMDAFIDVDQWQKVFKKDPKSKQFAIDCCKALQI